MVAADVAEIVRVGGNMGLELNTSKSELNAHQELLVNDSQNKPSTPHCQGRTCSSRLLWKLWAQSESRLCSSLTIWATKSLLSLPMIRRGNFSSNDSIALQRFNAILLHESFGWECRRPGP